MEFLLGPDGRYVFVEMNRRIQVEHAVTEEVTGVDLVQAQIRIAARATLADLGLADQSSIEAGGSAFQCRITTEDLANGPTAGRPCRRRGVPGPSVATPDDVVAYSRAHGAVINSPRRLLCDGSARG